VRVTFWGTRGSLATPGPDTLRYGGNTSCVEVRGDGGDLLVLDAGTGIRPLGESIDPGIERVDILLTHLHMDHIQGLGFFDPLFWPDLEVHLWGPSSTTLGLHTRLSRYLSPPLFPVRLGDLPCRLTVHEVVALRHFSIGDLDVEARLVCHPGPTVGYRIKGDGAVLTYLPDHEPALGLDALPDDLDWIPGIELAYEADLLIHDAQYSPVEYPRYVGWGHSSIPHALAFAKAAKVGHLVAFHHDPSHSDKQLDRLFEELHKEHDFPFEFSPAVEGETFRLGADGPQGDPERAVTRGRAAGK
jgi:phosphoribosyl 1,2-cyclic phosphodiesterase